MRRAGGAARSAARLPALACLKRIFRRTPPNKAPLQRIATQASYRCGYAQTAYKAGMVPTAPQEVIG